jgi:hypothetical protein
MTFGRKGLAAAQPGSDEYADTTGADDALALLSQMLGVNLNFYVSYIFDPSLWQDPRLAAELTNAGIQPQMNGNRKPMLADAQVAARMRAAAKDDPIRQSLVAAGIGLVPYDPGKPGGFDAGKTAFHRSELAKIASSPASAEGKRYAVLNLFDWTIRLIEGEIEMALPGLG